MNFIICFLLNFVCFTLFLGSYFFVMILLLALTCVLCSFLDDHPVIFFFVLLVFISLFFTIGPENITNFFFRLTDLEFIFPFDFPFTVDNMPFKL